MDPEASGTQLLVVSDILPLQCVEALKNARVLFALAGFSSLQRVSGEFRSGLGLKHSQVSFSTSLLCCWTSTFGHYPAERLKTLPQTRFLTNLALIPSTHSIAPVNACLTTLGRPYFLMELVMSRLASCFSSSSIMAPRYPTRFSLKRGLAIIRTHSIY